jgi:hypothetical protein
MLTYFRNLWLGLTTVLHSMGVAWRHYSRAPLHCSTLRKVDDAERSRARLLTKLWSMRTVRFTTGCITIQTENGKDEPDCFASDGTVIKSPLQYIDMTLAAIVRFALFLA